MRQPVPPLTHPSAPPPTWRIELDLLETNPFQPRSHIDEATLSELMDSIRNHGLLQPITARKTGTRYQIIAGHRRVEAFRRLRTEKLPGGAAAEERFATIPAHEKFDVSDEEMALFALVENLQRDDLSLRSMLP
jgi:ParB family chromosome partitioning protein